MKSIFTSGQFLNCSILRENYFSRIFILLIIPLLFISVQTFGQGVGSTVAGFEVDASFKSGQIPSFWKTTAPNQTYFGGTGDDWSKGPTGNAVLKQSGGVSIPGLTADRTAIWQVDGNWGSNVPPDMSVFGGSSNKNGDLIGEGQSPYLLDIGSGGPQKNDITNVFLHTRTVSSNLWLFVGAETRSINGSSYLDFEYNQAGVTTGLDAEGKSRMIGQGTVGGRTVDDILLVINYTQGGKTPVVGIRKWLANGTWSAELTLPANTTFMTTNILDVEGVAPNASYSGDGTTGNTSVSFQVVEGAINITSLGLAGLSQCSPNATVTVKTRSSASYTSELKDWDILHFPLTPSAMAAVANISPQCAPAAGSTVFNVSGTYADGTPLWSTTAGTLSNQSYVNGVATATLTLAPGVITANVTLTTTSPNANCPTAFQTKTATVYPKPTVVASATPAGSLSILTVPPQYALHTTVNGVLDPLVGFTYLWSQDPPTGGLSFTNIPNPTFSAPAAGEYIWTVLVTNVNGCTNTSSVSRELIPQAPCPAVNRPPMCAGTTYVFTADAGPVSGESWTWSVNNGASINGATNAQTVSVTAGSSSFTLTLTKTYLNPALSPQICPYSVTVNPAAVNPDVTMSVITCTTKNMTITITNAQATTTYDIYQLNQNHVVKAPPHANPLVVSGLTLGEGYRVIGTTSNGCISAPTDCGNFAGFVPTQNLVTQKTTAPVVTDDTAPEAAKTAVKDVINIELLAGKSVVSATPNPYSEKVQFSVVSQMSGYGSLEIYNLAGQKITTVYQGQFEQFKSRVFDFKVPVAQRKDLIYVFRMGAQKTSGVLIGNR